MNFCTSALNVIEIEAQAIYELTHKIDVNFQKACELLLACNGRVVVTGMGKSGHIARKIAATLSSTGTPAFFLHPGEASHGDLGMITRQDVVIMLSHSGNTPELHTLLPLMQRLQIPLIALTGNPHSAFAKAATVHIDASIQKEACPLGLAPTTSTTVALVLGDALAIALLEARGFNANDFALSHPGGSLGKRLILKVDDMFHSEEAMPLVTESTTIRETLIEVTSKKLGMTCVVNDAGSLTGIYTDGDIRRTLMDDNCNIQTTPVKSVMTKSCRTIKPGTLAAEALGIMQKFKITSLVVMEENSKKPLGVLHLHDLLREGIF